MVDSGCSSLLLPLSDETKLRDVMVLFCSEDYVWDIVCAKSVTFTSLSLNISRVDENNIPVHLCRNLNLRGHHPDVADLRFYLCPDDARALMNSPDVDRLRRGRALLTDDYTNLQDRHRRTHALLGQSYMRHVFCAQHLEVCFGMRVVGGWSIQSDFVQGFREE